jgi:F-type H+-transporting ATPase subunit gamma
MPSLLDLRRRIRSVKNTQQITKAMKMVAAAKLRRAQERVIAARPYSRMLAAMLSNVASAAGESASHPLLESRPEKKVLLLLVTADRGLCGAFNSNLIKAAQQFLQDHAGKEVTIEAAGRKGREFFRRRHSSVNSQLAQPVEKSGFSDAKALATFAANSYAEREYDAVYLIYNEFRSVIAQKVEVRRLLPIELGSSEVETPKDYIYEQPPAELLGSLLPRYVENGVWQAFIDSTASEHAARMTAMDAATSNASDVIDRLTLYMNRVRQASITKEIIEVVSGASALN